MAKAKFDLIGEVAKSYSVETGEPMTRGVAAVYVDRMCEAFYQKAMGAGLAYAVADMPDVARHLMWRWTGKDGAELRAEMARQGVTQ